MKAGQWSAALFGVAAGDETKPELESISGNCGHWRGWGRWVRRMYNVMAERFGRTGAEDDYGDAQVYD